MREFYYKENNGLMTKEYNENFTLHRKDGPAKVYSSVHIFDEVFLLLKGMQSGKDERKAPFRSTIFEWHNEGKLHREDGPAILQTRDDTGETLKKEWWLEGKKIEK